jgi:hypothetical protein
MNCPIQIFQNGQTYRIKVGISGCYGFGVRENEELPNFLVKHGE